MKQMWTSLKSPNIGLLFYKRLYQEPKIKELLSMSNGKLIFNVKKEGSEFNDFYNSIYDKKIEDLKLQNTVIGNSSIVLHSTYPGLLIGSGYTHNTASVGDASVGFYFSHTSGLPELPGSSLKGIIRSIFENDKSITDETSLAAFNFIISEIIEKNPSSKWSEFLGMLTIEQLDLLKLETFGSQDNDGLDVFYSASIDDSASGNFLASDYITPHYKNVLKNPDPIQFIKVLSNVPFLFQFKLKPSLIIPEIDIKMKEEFYKEVLLTLGIGAKTNVGYGHLNDPTSKPIGGNHNNPSTAIKINEGLTYEGLAVGDELDAIIKSFDSGVILDLQLKNIKFITKLVGVSPKIFELNQIIKVRVTSVGKKFNLTYIEPKQQ